MHFSQRLQTDDDIGRLYWSFFVSFIFFLFLFLLICHKSGTRHRQPLSQTHARVQVARLYRWLHETFTRMFTNTEHCSHSRISGTRDLVPPPGGPQSSRLGTVTCCIRMRTDGSKDDCCAHCRSFPLAAITVMSVCTQPFPPSSLHRVYAFPVLLGRQHIH